MRAILTCVDYWDLLAITLPWNRHHFESVHIVTTPADIPKLEDLACSCQADLIPTEKFYEGGAQFNKWAALEYGLDVMGRTGWICLMDADVLWPMNIPYMNLCQNSLYTPLRYMMEDLSKPIPPEESWYKYPIHRNIHEWAGYTQIFHATDPVLGEPPWHETNWKHAGGADSFFQLKWSSIRKIRPNFKVLHLGPPGTNWCGRSTPFLDGTSPERMHQNIRAIRQLAMERAQARHKGEHKYDHEKLGHVHVDEEVRTTPSSIHKLLNDPM